MTRISMSACLLLFTLAALPSDAAIQLRLWVEPQAQLPAIEPSLRVEAVNTGGEPAELPALVALQVIPPGEQEPFIAYTGLRGEERVTWVPGSSKELAPKETRDVSFWAGPESPVWFAGDSRLLQPGTYRFQLVAHDRLDSDRLERVSRVVDQPGLTDPVVSNEATYIVETPKGEDAAVWELIRRLQSPTFWKDALGARIWAEYPNSRYAAFCLREPKASDPETAIAAYTAALQKQPTRPWAEWYRLGIAREEISRSQAFISARDVDGAYQARKRANALLTQLAAGSLNSYLRKKAQELLDAHAWSREELDHYIKRSNGELRETEPFALCVEKGSGGKHIFWFAYENYTRDAMKIPIGPENKFTPPPFDRGQPNVFPPHETVLGVRVETDEPAVTWHLRKYNVQASLAKTPPCPADLHERFTYRPPLRE